MNKQELLTYVDKKYQKREQAPFRVGDTVKVHVRITEGGATRVQVFEGVVISFKGSGSTRMVTVRKISFGVGVERIFPLYSPSIEKIAVVRSGHVRRAKLYYLRDRMGKASRLEEKDVLKVDGEAPLSAAPAAVSSAPEATVPTASKEEAVTTKEA